MSLPRPVGQGVPDPGHEAPKSAVSSARLAANRANAKRSTGPRSVVGKITSSRNATRHGILSRQPLVPGEDPAELEILSRGLLEQLNPEGGVEELLVADVIGVAWRLRRVALVEVGLYTAGLNAPALRVLSGSGEATSAIGLAFAGQASNLAILSRYEAALVGRLRRALTELGRLQATRASEVALVVSPVPMANGFVSQSAQAAGVRDASAGGMALGGDEVVAGEVRAGVGDKRVVDPGARAALGRRTPRLRETREWDR